MDEEHHLCTTKLTKVSNNGVSHDINVAFYSSMNDNTAYSNNNSNPKIPTDDQLETGCYFYRVQLKTKETGKLVGYDIIEAKNSGENNDLATVANNTGAFSITIPANHDYKMLDSNKKEVNGAVAYDPSVYDIDVRMYKLKENTSLPNNLNGVSTAGDDVIPKFDFWDNNTAVSSSEGSYTSRTDMRLYSKYNKIYQIVIESDDNVSFSSSKPVNIRVDSKHDTTGTDVYVGSIVASNTNSITIKIEDQSNKSKHGLVQTGHGREDRCQP